MVKKFKNKTLFYALFLILVLGGIGAYSKFFSNASKTNQYRPKAPIYSSRDHKDPPKGTSTSSASSVPPSQGSNSSTSGLITIGSPSQGAIVRNSSPVSGTAKTNPNAQVYYRLKGGASGQIANGPVTVTNNHFALKLEFMNDIRGGMDQGILQVYVFNGGGAESDVASVNVNIE